MLKDEVSRVSPSVCGAERSKYLRFAVLKKK